MGRGIVLDGTIATEPSKIKVILATKPSSRMFYYDGMSNVMLSYVFLFYHGINDDRQKVESK